MTEGEGRCPSPELGANMGDNEQEEKVCGFDKEPCIKERCVFWAEVFQGTQLGAPKKVPMCVFHALLLVAGSPKPELGKIPLSQLVKT